MGPETPAAVLEKMVVSETTFIFTMGTVTTCLCADKYVPVERESDDTEDRGASAGAMTLSKGGEEFQC